MLPSGPSWMVIPCSSLGWNRAPPSTAGVQPVASEEFGRGDGRVYSVAVAEQMSPQQKVYTPHEQQYLPLHMGEGP